MQYIPDMAKVMIKKKKTVLLQVIRHTVALQSLFKGVLMSSGQNHTIEFHYSEANY